VNRLLVPELTLLASIKPNNRISLRRHAPALSLLGRAFPKSEPAHKNRLAFIYRRAGFNRLNL
jgi:hypothetical protein